MREVGALVEQALDGARTPALVVTDLPVTEHRSDVVVQRTDVAAEAFRTVLLVVADVADLRRTVSRLAPLGKARTVLVLVLRSAAPVVVRAHPSWPAVVDVEARLLEGPDGSEGPAALTRVELAVRHDVVPVLVGLARGSALPVTGGPGGLWAAGDVVPPLDPLFSRTYDPAAELPPDVVVTTAADADAVPVDQSPVTGRAPLVVGHDAAGDRPLDEALFNPVGWRRTWSRGPVDLPADARLTPGLVAGLRDAQSVRLPPSADPDLVAALAMAGVPTEPVDDPAERERRSVRARRAALLRHSSVAWRHRWARAAGVRHEVLGAGVVTTAEQPDAVTDLLLAHRYSGADLVVMPDDPDEPGERFVTRPPFGAVAHALDRTPEQVVAAGGFVYLTHAASRT